MDLNLRHCGGFTVVVAVVAFQLIGLARYARRLPNDWVGIGLYVVVITAIVALSLILAHRCAERYPQSNPKGESR